jgi:hypothetical protein
VVDEDLAIGAVSEALDPCQGAYRAGEGLLEGDGWVNWSGLATLLDDLSKALDFDLGRWASLLSGQ